MTIPDQLSLLDQRRLDVADLRSVSVVHRGRAAFRLLAQEPGMSVEQRWALLAAVICPTASDPGDPRRAR